MKNPIVVLLIVAVVGAAAFIAYDQSQEEAYRKLGDSAITMATSACLSGNGIVYQLKLADAKSKIAELPPEKQAIWQAKMSNQMIMLGCKP